MTLHGVPSLWWVLSLAGDARRRSYHVKEGVSHIALILEVDGKVEEVILALKLLIDGRQQHLLCILVGNVLHHECGPLVLACTIPC